MLKKSLICLVILISLFCTSCGKKEGSLVAPDYNNNESGSMDTDIYIDESRKIYYEAYYTFYTKKIELILLKVKDFILMKIMSLNESRMVLRLKFITLILHTS